MLAVFREKQQQQQNLCCNKNGLTKFQPNSRSWQTREAHADDTAFSMQKNVQSKWNTGKKSGGIAFDFHLEDS